MRATLVVPLALLLAALWLNLAVVSPPIAPQTARAAEEAPLADPEITRAVENELFAERIIPHDDVDVTTRDGVVTLSGKVPDLLAREHATRLAQTVRGVRSVVNRLLVVPPVQRTDAQLESDIKNALRYDAATESFEIAVSVENGVAALRGTVESHAERELVGRVAQGVNGLREVHNQVWFSYTGEREDGEIRADIEAKLRWDATVDHQDVDVEVKDGNVRLSGTVGSDAERARAYLDAWVTGVRSVNSNDLGVDPSTRARHERAGGERFSEDELEQAVTDALLFDPRVSSFAVTPEADGSEITLRGTVENVQARRAAAQDARATVGVSRVINHVRVRPPAEKAADIVERVEAALDRDPLLDRQEIQASFFNGTLYLSGMVDSFTEKMRADQIASRARGVQAVRNNLAVRYDQQTLVYDPWVYDYYPYDYEWYTSEPRVTYLSDAEIRDDIEDELFWSPYVDAEDIKVHVENGAARLRGTVDSRAEMYSAVSNAYEGGATWVDNDLRVR